MWRILVASLAGIAALALAAPAAGAARSHPKPEKRCSPAGIRAVHGTARAERRIRCLLNARRAHAGLRPLRWDRCLDRAAERHARDMVRRRYFAHASLGGRTLAQRIRAAGYLPRRGSWTLGENLAWGAGRRATAAATVRGWLRSPPHRRNVFTARFRDVGIAVVRGAPVPLPARARGGVLRATVVADFGVRRPGRCRR